jgi:hypothetical protein
VGGGLFVRGGAAAAARAGRGGVGGGAFNDGAGNGSKAGAARAGRGGRGAGGRGNPTLSSAFVRLLTAGAAGYTWAAATDGSDSAAAMELATGGVPVMAIGGFRGTDPAPTLAEFERLVDQHKIHYFVDAAGVGGPGGGAGRSDAAEITAWVVAHYRPATVGGETVYVLTGAR